MRHISNGTLVSPYISLTRSYEVAMAYAVFGRRVADEERVGYVYEIVCDERDRASRALVLVDPVKELVRAWPRPFAEHTYHHDGGQDFLQGVVAPDRFPCVLTRNYLQAPPGGGTPRPPALRHELEALVRALRDAEVLALRTVPPHCVKQRFRVSASGFGR